MKKEMNLIDALNHLLLSKEIIDLELYDKAVDQINDLLILVQKENREEISNFLWKFKTIFQIKKGYIQAFSLIKNKEYLDSWALLAELETDIVLLEKNIDDIFSQKYKVFFYKEMVKNWQSLFPYKIFFSMGFTVKYYLCSICSEVVKPRNRCKHKKGMLYNGELCFHIGGEIEEIKEISVVRTPMQKICIPLIDYDYSIVDYVSERLQHPIDGWVPVKSKRTLKRSDFDHLDEDAICPCQEEMTLFKDCCFNKDKIELPHIDILFEKSLPPELENEIIRIGKKVLTNSI